MVEDKISGVVEKIIFKNDDNGYHVLSVLVKETGKECTVTTSHLKITEGISYEFLGEWGNSTKYGNQFKASRVIEIPPSNNDAMIRYLSSSFFKGIGVCMATKIVKHFGEETYDVLKTNIDRLTEVPGISKKKLEVIKKSWQENGEINEIMIFLQSYDISTLYASRIYEYFGNECVSKIRTNPYSLQQIDGIGFKYSDKIALDIGFAKDSKERISAGIKYILSEGENDGHCFLYHPQILKKSIEILGVAIEDKIDGILQELINNNEIKLSELNGSQMFYSNEVYYAERWVANKIDIIKNSPGLIYNENIIKEWEENTANEDVQLSDEQKEAVLGIIYEKISVLTGGAGVGKTVCVKQLVDLLSLLKIDFSICCPTGKAAMRVMELSGCYASTIHKLLQWDFVNVGFVHNEKCQLPGGQYYIVDEASMINISLMSSLLKAIPNDCHILFCGDNSQLSPISAGAPFSDLINGNCVKVYRLTKTFRQKNGIDSDIIRCANDIRVGIEPLIDSPIEEPELWTTNKKDCLFIDSGIFEDNKSFNEYPKWHSLSYGYDILEMVKKLYLEIIPKYYPEQKIQIISPMNKGVCGCNLINSVIRDIVNPPSKDKAEINLKSRILRVGDLIINVMNNYSVGIMNGEMGVIKSIDSEEKTAIIQFEYENRTVELKRSDLLHIKHSYSVSCHKFQGSESPIIIAPLSTAHYPLLYRSMLYTLISRGRNLVVLVGERKCLKIATDNVRDNNRQTNLIELLKLKSNI